MRTCVDVSVANTKGGGAAYQEEEGGMYMTSAASVPFAHMTNDLCNTAGWVAALVSCARAHRLRRSFHMQFKLMTSWALVADIYFLPPQKIQDGESGADFANRVQAMIAEVAQLRQVPWDGYLKYYNLAEKVRSLSR
jgi:phosphate/sulfate permease